METVAVYREDPIRTYGLEVVSDLSLIEIEPDKESMPLWGKILLQAARNGLGYQLSLFQNSNTGPAKMFLVVKKKHLPRWRTQTQADNHHRMLNPIRIVEAVDLIHFHGPHFGDRSGIFEAAYNSLLAGALPVLAAACCGSSIFLVFPQGFGQAARRHLRKSFEIPDRSTIQGSRQ